MKPTFLSKVFQAALMCCLAVILSGCDDFLANSDNPTGTTLIMNTGDATLKVGELLDRPAITNSPAYVLYSSSDPAVATVGHTGTVTAIAPGTATITAHVQAVGNYAAASASYKVTVEVKVGKSGLLAGKFSVSATKQVQFSQGNLQATYDGTKWIWAFAANQWDFIGDNTTTATGNGNTSINGDGTVSAANVTVDLFGWVGASNTTWGTGAAKYGISNNNNNPSTNGDYGTGTSDALKSDWGNTMDADWSNKTGESTTGWRTLTKDEWTYLFNGRTTTSGIRYAKATVNGKAGVILLPDDWSTSYYGLSTTADYTANDITLADWTDKLEAHGAVFLPAAGYRDVTTVNNVGTLGLYWSSSPYTDASRAYCAYFSSSSLIPNYSFTRYYGFSVRLVRDAE